MLKSSAVDSMPRHVCGWVMGFRCLVGVCFYLAHAHILMRNFGFEICMPKRNDLEQKALHFVVNTGYQGVLQSELWRELSASSREGSRVAIKLEEKGLIRREKELEGGRWTYRLYPKRLPASIETIVDCPCLMCADNARCDPTTAISPKSCERLTVWITGLDKSKAADSPAAL